MPRANRSYWQPKLERNVQRDAETVAALADMGWHTIRVWEHDDPADATQRVRAALAELSATGSR